MKYIKRLINISFLVLSFAFIAAPQAQAQTSWSQCTDGTRIARCETYDCPQGDTNKDGVCSQDDTGARLSDSRNDPFCANPLTGCGQVNYYNEQGGNACSVRVKESGPNCDLYKAGNPSFTPVPTRSPFPTSTPRSSFFGTSPSPRAVVSPTPTPIPSKRTLPNTGPSELALLGLVTSGFIGIYLNDRFKRIK